MLCDQATPLQGCLRWMRLGRWLPPPLPLGRPSCWPTPSCRCAAAPVSSASSTQLLLLHVEQRPGLQDSTALHCRCTSAPSCHPNTLLVRSNTLQFGTATKHQPSLCPSVSRIVGHCLPVESSSLAPLLQGGRGGAAAGAHGGGAGQLPRPHGLPAGQRRAGRGRGGAAGAHPRAAVGGAGAVAVGGAAIKSVYRVSAVCRSQLLG
jgi:hypothetical protein